MATVPTETGTYLEDLFNPEVVGDMVNEKLVDNLVFSPLARIDYTLQGVAGDTVKLPYYDYIGDAEEVEEGHDIQISKLTQNTKSVAIRKIGKAVQFTDEALLSGYGDPYGEATRQIVTAIGSKVESLLIADMNGNTDNVYTAGAGGLTPDDIPLALALYGEENEGQKALVCDADFYAKLLNTNAWVPASDIAADVVIRGTLGMAYGCQVIVSNRVKGSNFHIVKPGALAIFMKRDVLVEFDRDIVNQSNVIVGSKLFAPYLMNPGAAIKIVSGIDSGLAKITVSAAAGSTSGKTALTLSGYTPAAGESYKIYVGDTLPNVTLNQDVSGWDSWDGSADVTAATGKTVVVVSAKSGKAVAAGSVKAVAAS